jgi:hypothetical protein
MRCAQRIGARLRLSLARNYSRDLKQCGVRPLRVAVYDRLPKTEQRFCGSDSAEPKNVIERS